MRWRHRSNPDVEWTGAELSADARRDLRREHSIPLLAKIAAERDQLAQTVLPKSPLGEALRYLTNQWAALQRFVDDGRIAPDNNRAENQLRVVALGRNYDPSAIMQSISTLPAPPDDLRRSSACVS
jgi:hypothetical protein